MASIKRGKIQIELYGVTVHVVFADELMDAVKIHKLTGIKDEDVFGYEAIVPELHAIEATSYRNYYCFLLPETKPHIIAHECLHLALRILSHRGIFIEYGGKSIDDEACAYLLGFLTKKILEIQAKPYK